ncbi:MAG: hypothetical protein QOK43_2842 [Acidimicrobiaceae bacterium]|nr:hypothetical protein [Acidimicrobiaceae bacterium]
MSRPVFKPGLSVLCVLAVATLFAGCSDKGKEGEGLRATEPCAEAPAAFTGNNGLPSTFPVPKNVVLSETRTAGPSTVVGGYAEADLKAVFDSFKSALGKAPYSVTKSEKDAHDAEVNFAGEGNTGQVRLGEECKGRTSVGITIRPK